MKKFFSLVLALVMALSLTTVAWGAVAATDAAKIGDTGYATLAAAVTAATDGDEIVLLKDVADGVGIVIDKKLTIDFGGYTYTFASDPVGSTGTESQGFQILKAANAVTLKNGTLTSKAGSGVKMLVNNYCNLTLDGMTLIGTNLDDATQGKYVLSNNAGDVVIEDTTITAAADGVAFDSYDYSAGGYTPPTVTVKGTSVVTGEVVSDGGALVVEAGTFNGEITVTNAADVTVKAGTFTDDVIPYLATGSVYKDGVVTKQGTVPSTGTTSTGTVTSGTVTPSKPTLYKLAAVGGSMEKVTDTFTSIKLTTVSGKIDSNVPKYVPNIYNIDGNLYIQVAKAAAEYALYNNGAWIYLYDAPQTTDADVITAYATSVVMDKLVVPADDEIDCGDCLKNGALASYYVSGDSVYYAGGYTWAYFNGEFVKYDKDTKVAFQGHVWDADSIIYKATDVKGSKVPVTIECENCEKTFKVVYKTAFDNTWVKGVNYETAPGVLPTDYYIVLESATSAPVVTPDTDKVQSAETFDAGIAMYVGMSVMAAAGSVVVLKKKD